MVNETKDVPEEDTASRLVSIQEQLDAAIAIEATAQNAQNEMAGLHALGESSDGDLASAQETLSHASAHTSALRSALTVLTQRQTAQDVQKAAAKVDRLRTESATAARAQEKALEVVANAADKLRSALEVVKAQGAILAGLYQQIASASPEQAAEIEADKRDALALIGKIFDAKRANLKEAASAGQYRLQDDGTGVDRTVAADLSLLDDVVVFAGTKQSEARGMVLSWEMASLDKIAQELHEAQAQEWLNHAARIEIGLGAFLGASLEEIRSAAALEVDDLALLMPDKAARSLAQLTQWLPASTTEAISHRDSPRSPLLARQNEAKFQSGLATLRGLVAG